MTAPAFLRSRAVALAAPVNPSRAAVTARAMTYLIAFGVFLGVAWAYRAGYYRGEPYPASTFLMGPWGHFHDLTDFFAPLKANDPVAAFSVYPPFSYLIVEPFVWVGRSASTLIWLLIAIGGLGAFVSRQLDFISPMDRAASVAVLTFINYPFLFSFDRGNLDVFVTVLLAGFVWSLQTNRPLIAAGLIGAAGAMKGYPIVFAALLLIRREWSATIAAIVVAAALTLVSTAYLGLGVGEMIDLLRTNLASFNETYAVGNLGLAFGSSLFGVLKLFSVDVLGVEVETIRSMLPIYSATTTLALIGVIVAIWRLPLRFWEQITLLCVATTLLPAVSNDYKLLALVIPLALFIRYGTDDPLRWWYAGAFITLMIPKAYVLLRPLSPEIDSAANLGVIINPIALLMLGAMVLISGARRRKVGSGTSDVAEPRSV